MTTIIEPSSLLRDARGPRERIVAALLAYPIAGILVAAVVVTGIGGLAGVAVHSVAAADTVEVVLAEDPRDVGGVPHARVRTPAGAVETVPVYGATERGDVLELTVRDGELGRAPMSPISAAFAGWTAGLAVFAVALVFLIGADPRAWLERRIARRKLAAAQPRRQPPERP